MGLAVGAALLVGMLGRLGPELADDGAFFLRYAQNMSHGQFWVWNPGGPHVWGASDPLWPLLVAIPLAFGAPPLGAMVSTSLALSVVSLATTTLLLARRVGYLAGLAFVSFCLLDSGLMYYSAAGLETPLTLLLLTGGVWVLLYPPRPWVAGAVGGALMVNKVDLVPVGLLLLGAYWLERGSFPRRAVLTALGIAGSWYCFAWAYFGAPVPNSFITKAFDQSHNHRSITWTWFGHYVLVEGPHRWLSYLLLASVAYGVVARSPLALFLGGLLVVDLAGYSIKYPFEPYDWYAMPAVYALLVGASGGVELLGRGVQAAGRYLGLRRGAVACAAAAGLVLTGMIVRSGVQEERAITGALKSFSRYQEFDRAEAGRWVSTNTPRSFTVYTLWGNPAAYSRRYVIDGSFLNWPYQTGDLVKEYRPDVEILQNNPGSTPGHPVFAFDTQGYTIVKVFDRSYLHGLDYFFAVLVRDDQLGGLRPS